MRWMALRRISVTCACIGHERHLPCVLPVSLMRCTAQQSGIPMQATSAPHLSSGVHVRSTAGPASAAQEQLLLEVQSKSLPPKQVSQPVSQPLRGRRCLPPPSHLS